MMSVVSIADFLQGITIIISVTAYLPQWRTLLQNRSSKNISLSAWVLWFVSAGFTLFYAIVHFLYKGAGGVLVATSIVSFVFVVFTLALILYFQGQDGAQAEPVSEE